MKKVLSVAMAATMALTSSVCVFAEGKDDVALRSALSKVKQRLDIPKEFSEFTYNVSTRNQKELYSFNWATDKDAVNSGNIFATICGSVITNYNRYISEDTYSPKPALAKLTADELYKKAQSAVKMLNPSVYKSIEIDRDSLSIYLTSDRAVFNVVRTKNGIPVKNNRGSIVLDKNTGELMSFDINWHVNASFKSDKGVIALDKAKDCYQDMIDLEPVYTINYDYEDKAYVSELVYRQTSYGEINAYTGAKSNFAADGYYGDVTTDSAEDESASVGSSNGAMKEEFTPEELEELNKELPYGTEAAVKQLLKESEYLHYDEDMQLSYSYLRKNSTTGEYTYNIRFTNEKYAADEKWEYGEIGEVSDDYYFYQEIYISLNAETGEIFNYSFYDTSDDVSYTYDKVKADKTAEAVAKEFAGDKFSEYEFESSDVNSSHSKTEQLTRYYGSYHTWQRKANGFDVEGNVINVELNSKGELASYRKSYTDTEFASPDKMLSEDEIMEKFWDKNELNLYYLARVNENRTKTVLVYGTNSSVYADAFTGEAVYSRYYDMPANDLSKIKDKKLLKKAEILAAHGFNLGEVDPKAAATESIFADMLNRITEVRLYGMIETLVLADGRKYQGESKALTNGDAMIMFAAAECGVKVAELGGIFKSPYKDVDETDKNIGFYAIAHKLSDSDSDTLNADKPFTYADMINFVYDYIA